MTLITCLEIDSNYPENILLQTTEFRGRWFSYMYLLRNGSVHKLMLSREPTETWFGFDTEEDALMDMQKISVKH